MTSLVGGVVDARAGSGCASRARPRCARTRAGSPRRSRLAAGSGMLQWIAPAAGEFGADLADAVAQGDHVVEPPPGELAQVLGPAAAMSIPRSRMTRTAFGAPASDGCRRCRTAPPESRSVSASAICERRCCRCTGTARGRGRRGGSGAAARAASPGCSAAPAPAAARRSGQIQRVVGVAAVRDTAARHDQPPSRSWRRWYEPRLCGSPASRTARRPAGRCVPAR